VKTRVLDSWSISSRRVSTKGEGLLPRIEERNSYPGEIFDIARHKSQPVLDGSRSDQPIHGRYGTFKLGTGLTNSEITLVSMRKPPTDPLTVQLGADGLSGDQASTRSRAVESP
jgi:hypothetical protein